MPIVHRPFVRSCYRALALTATVHAGLAGLLVPPSTSCAAPDDKAPTRRAKNTRPVVLAQLPPYYIPAFQLPDRKLVA